MHSLNLTPPSLLIVYQDQDQEESDYLIIGVSSGRYIKLYRSLNPQHSDQDIPNVNLQEQANSCPIMEILLFTIISL